jgi:hypothetical protein
LEVFSVHEISSYRRYRRQYSQRLPARCRTASAGSLMPDAARSDGPSTASTREDR